MQIVFSDAHYWNGFLPLTFTRPVSELRCGILTFSERWQKLLNQSEIAYITEDYLQKKYQAPEPKESLFIVPNFIPSQKILDKIKNLEKGQALAYKDELLVAKVDMSNFSLNQIEYIEDIQEGEIRIYTSATDLFSYNEEAINFDFEILTEGRQSQPLSETNGFLGEKEDLFIEEGATVEFVTINCKKGKVYIGKNAEVMEGVHLRGPVSLGESSVFNLGAKVYGATTIGPYCKIGGEINNIIVFGYSNKGHDGFIGNSVIGEWCNFGADTNSSNLKNNYAEVKLWNYKEKKYQSTGLQFCGLVMGDHSKTAINTQLNTGTSVGVFANIFRGGFPPNLVESFSWGGQKDSEKFILDKAFEIAEKVMARRGKELTDIDKEILKEIYHQNI